MQTNNNIFLGTGWAYPVQAENGKTKLTSGSLLVQQSIGIILNTPIGTKFMLPEFGSRLSEIIFEPNDRILENLLRTFIQQAIGQWEKRVKFADAFFDFGEQSVSCMIMYNILASNQIESFIFPFYRKLIY